MRVLIVCSLLSDSCSSLRIFRLMVTATFLLWTKNMYKQVILCVCLCLHAESDVYRRCTQFQNRHASQVSQGTAQHSYTRIGTACRTCGLLSIHVCAPVSLRCALLQQRRAVQIQALPRYTHFTWAQHIHTSSLFIRCLWNDSILSSNTHLFLYLNHFLTLHSYAGAQL